MLSQLVTYIILFGIFMFSVKIIFMGGRGRRYRDDGRGKSLMASCITSFIFVIFAVFFFKSPFLINICSDLPFFQYVVSIFSGINNFDSATLNHWIKEIPLWQELFKTIVFLGIFIFLQILLDKIFEFSKEFLEGSSLLKGMVMDILVTIAAAFFSNLIANMFFFKFSSVISGEIWSGLKIWINVLMVFIEILIMGGILAAIFLVFPGLIATKWLIVNIVAALAKLLGCYMFVILTYCMLNIEEVFNQIGTMIIIIIGMILCLSSLGFTSILSSKYGDIDYKSRR